jgi:hypothetical protein
MFVRCSMLGDVSGLASFTLLENKLGPDCSMQKTLAKLTTALHLPSKIPCHIRQLLKCNAPHHGRGQGGRDSPTRRGKPASFYGIELNHISPTTLPLPQP